MVGPLNFLKRRRSDVAGTRTNHLICLILLNAMADPANGSSQRKESDCTSRRQIQRTSERNKAEKDRWAFAEQVVCFLSDTLREKHGGGVRVDLSSQLKQEFSPWVAHGVENSAKSGNHFSKSGNGFASFEQARHGRTDVGRSISFPEKCFNPFCLSSMLDPLECQ